MMPQNIVKNNNQPAIHGAIQLALITSEAGGFTERSGKRKRLMLGKKRGEISGEEL